MTAMRNRPGVYPTAACAGPGGISRRGRVRAVSVVVLLVFGAMLGVGLYLTPDGSTHTQLGLPPCGFYTRYGVPCPSCGYTTAVSQVAHGQWLGAVATQPAGAALGLLAVAMVVLGAIGLITGRWHGPDLFWLSWHWKPVLLAVLALVLMAWVYKIAVTGAGFSRLW